MTDVRLVPMTREQRDVLEALADYLHNPLMDGLAPRPEDLVAAWDNAPADCVDAANEALGGTGRYGDIAAVLAALGMPAGSADA